MPVLTPLKVELPETFTRLNGPPPVFLNAHASVAELKLTLTGLAELLSTVPFPLASSYKPPAKPGVFPLRSKVALPLIVTDDAGGMALEEPI